MLNPICDELLSVTRKAAISPTTPSEVYLMPSAALLHVCLNKSLLFMFKKYDLLFSSYFMVNCDRLCLQYCLQ